MNDDYLEKELDRLLALRVERLRADNYSYEDLLVVAARCWIDADISKKMQIDNNKIYLSLSDVCSKVIPDVASKAVAATKSHSARNAIEARHNKPGGSREKKAELLAIWATGQYKTKDECVEDMARFLDMNLSTARKALQGTPDPDPWPAKSDKS